MASEIKKQLIRESTKEFKKLEHESKLLVVGYIKGLNDSHERNQNQVLN